MTAKTKKLGFCLIKNMRRSEGLVAKEEEPRKSPEMQNGQKSRAKK